MVNGVKMKLIKTEDEQGVMYSLSGDNLPENYVLSKQNCDEIFEIVTPESMMKDILSNCEKTKEGYIIGFQMAMELNKDKVFTLKDMENGIDMCIELMNNKGSEFRTHKQTIIQSLRQPTEIEVEIEMRPASLVYKSNLVIEELDSEGCLVLTKKI